MDIKALKERVPTRGYDRLVEELTLRRDKLLCVLAWIHVCEFVGRCGSAKRWAVDIEEGFWEMEIIEDEEDKNVTGEGGAARGESIVSAVDALLDKHCEFELSPDWVGDKADGDGKS
ncbi:hypothetical protein KY285_023778 [Solanum tuberosum]|nr:hypothetical protein KY289_024110 [Solanum tuberosum]KAH0675977.1 hypothetical protein KY285_023778 [Solanum tuberosum]